MEMDEHPKETNVSTELAKERTREAADRTLMAWIRTCLSLIGFGFGIAKFRDILVEAGRIPRAGEHIHSTLIFGLSFISLGIFGLLAAVVQHWRILQHIKFGEFPIYRVPPSGNDNRDLIAAHRSLCFHLHLAKALTDRCEIEVLGVTD